MWVFVYNLNFQRRKAMFFKMLKNDLRQKKALNFVLFLFTLRNGASLELQSAKLCGDNRKFVIPDNANNTTLKTKYVEFNGASYYGTDAGLNSTANTPAVSRTTAKTPRSTNGT